MNKYESEPEFVQLFGLFICSYKFKDENGDLCEQVKWLSLKENKVIKNMIRKVEVAINE